MMSSIPQTALVTGGTGFLGGKLARRLSAEGWTVTALGRNEAAGKTLADSGIRFVRADLSDAKAVIAACRGQKVVFHCGARSSPWGRYAGFNQANTLGTRNVIAGCRLHGVDRLIHVSTPSLYFNFQDQFDIPETQEAHSPPANNYVKTKLEAESEVDAASSVLNVITLRPRALFGPGDTTLFPRLIRANSARGFPLIGDGDPLIDITCVENVVDALLLAAAAPAAALGRKFNITNGEPWLRSRLLSTLFEAVEIPLRFRKISYPAAYRLAWLLETTSKVFTASRWEPPLTRYTVGVLAKSQTLDIRSARELLGYKPRVSIADGISQFAQWWKQQGRYES